MRYWPLLVGGSQTYPLHINCMLHIEQFIDVLHNKQYRFCFGVNPKNMYIRTHLFYFTHRPTPQMSRRTKYSQLFRKMLLLNSVTCSEHFK